MSSSKARGAALTAMVVAGILAGATGVVAAVAPVQTVGGQASAADIPAGAAVPAPAPAPVPTDSGEPAPTTETVTPPPVTVTVPPPAADEPSILPTDPAEPDEPTGPAQPDVPDSSAANAGDTLHTDVATAVAVTEAYWNDVFTGWGVTWIGPQLYNGDGFYDSATGTGPACGDESAVEMNAFYCGHGEVGQGFVAWDQQLLEVGYDNLGDAFPYLVIAHEWAHVAQERFEADGEAPAVLAQQELQADCIAGATLAGAVDSGHLNLESGDTDELVLSLKALGDNHAWAGASDHGSSDERVAWFTNGFNGDLESCLGNADGSAPGSGN